jgi:hypothetical protein
VIVRALLALLAAIPLAGCSSLGSTQSHSSAVPSKLTQAQATHEYPSPPSPSPSPAPAQAAAGGSASPSRAVGNFAGAFINWTADTVAVRMRVLASESVGQARSSMQLAAAQTAQDYELQRGGIANSGTVEAVAPLAGRRDQYVVVTRELTTATATPAYQGLRPAWHVAIAAVVQLRPGRWVVSRWQPES